MIFKQQNFSISIFLLIFTALTSCSSSRYVNLLEVREESSVKLYMADGTTFEGLITQKTDSSFTLVNENDHQAHILNVNNIRQIEKSQHHYDLHGTQISNAEIEKYKSSRNAWGYAIGGAVLGGVVGILVDLPLWHADVGIAPYFMGGIGATAGSIFFGIRGIRQDREMAVAKVRYLRERQKELENKMTEEERQLAEIRKEAEELRKKIDKKDDNKN